MQKIDLKRAKKNITKLALLLGFGGFDGSIALAAVAGIFIMGNILLIAFLFMAGPASILTASLLEGNTRERAIVALLSGLLATSLIIVAASLGPILLTKFNLTILRTGGGIALIILAGIMMGLNISSKAPLVLMIITLCCGAIWR